jgi:hypothetical protein
MQSAPGVSGRAREIFVLVTCSLQFAKAGSAAALPQQGKYEDHRHFSLLTTRPPRQKLSALRHVSAPSTVRVEKVAPRPKGGAFGRPVRAAAKAKRI